jgi:deazaflavin-dependent oxidoreductase (nitroreductase family)
LWALRFILSEFQSSLPTLESRDAPVRARIMVASENCIDKEANMSVTIERINPNQKIIDEFRANDGKVGGRFEGRTLLLLHTTGAKTGIERVKPVAYVRDGENYVIIASKGGAPTNPDWYYNILAHPRLTVEVGAATFQVDARVTEEPERTRLYNKMVETFPGFDEYRRRTERMIPVIVLTRVE